MKTQHEPLYVTETSDTYSSDISRAFNWYNQEKDKKDARSYLRSFVGKEKAKIVDSVPDNQISTTYGWMARMIANGCKFRQDDVNKLNSYVNELLAFKSEVVKVEVVEVVKPTIRDYLEDKVKEYLGELEGVVDDILYKDITFSLYKNLQANHIPAQYCSFIDAWIKRKAGEFIGIYETDDKEVKNAYDHFGRRKVTALIKTFSEWLQDLERYSQFKKANRKPRVKKAKPAGAQVAKLKYKKEDTELKLKSVNPTEMVGASQVWIYNTKYKKLAVYRSDSRDGIQIKGTTLQNYDPEQSEQKALRKPAETIKKVLEGGKIVLRKIVTDLTTKPSPLNGRINEECIILRVIK